MTIIRKIWARSLDWFPISGFQFDRPLVLLQSDDWGRAGLRDREGLEQLQAAGVFLGERPYDLYTLETADDLAALGDVLKRHRDANGRQACAQMNFVVANLDFARMSADNFRRIVLLPLADGLPHRWNRPGLIDAYRQGISDGVFHAALHGSTHFCQSAVERRVADSDPQTTLLRTFWQAGTPYIHWRMPWVGYEYWDPEQPESDRFVQASLQRELVGQAIGGFAKLFSKLPRSACAPGYRANEDTHRAWAQHGIRVAQNGPGVVIPPHFDRHGILQLSRGVEFEPAVDAGFSVEACVKRAEKCFAQGLPAIVSVHAINFHSTVRDFRTSTLQYLDEFLTALESKNSDLLYLHDEDLYELVSKGSFSTTAGESRANVTMKKFTKRALAREQKP